MGVRSMRQPRHAERVRDAVEDMTGLEVLNVNVSVLGINISKETDKEVELLDESCPRHRQDRTDKMPGEMYLPEAVLLPGST